MVNAINDMAVLQKMTSFDERNVSNPMFKVFRQYMSMELEMMFVRAVRTANWQLHLQALELFSKYFFAHDRLNYARMIPVYLADMKALPQSDPDIYIELVDENWIVNKNLQVPFYGIGADNGLEHVNQSMKVSGGLIGITQNTSARAKFFLIAPELSRLAEQAKKMAGISVRVTERHHNLTNAVLSREERKICKLFTTIASFTNPFTQSGDELFNLVTKVVVPDYVKRDLCAQRTEGEKLLDTFVKERIQVASIKLWSVIKKRKLLTWKSTGKRTKVKVNDTIVELQEDRSLFARMMIVCHTRREINIAEAVGEYEFTVVPRVLFAADGTMLHCLQKSALMSLIEKEAPVTVGNSETTTPVARKKVDIVDGMVEVQSLSKPNTVKTCADLAQHFTDIVFNKHLDCDELHLVFDRYDVPLSLKVATRVRRQGLEQPVSYRISESIHIAKVPMRHLLSHNKTKMELTKYLASKSILRAEQRHINLVVAWSSDCQATQKDVSHLQSSNEEADTKLILHAFEVATNGATEINVFSPDTDVFVLLLRRYPELCRDVHFVTGTGERRRRIKLQPIA